ncbi:MAG: cation diffusion facilitator family transporter [bacterium]
MGGHHHHHSGHSHLAERTAETQRVAVVGAVVNLLLSAVKLAAGVLANSAALIADGIHSLSDLASDALVWFAARHAGHGPDKEHPYGHGRFETAGTLGLGILLVMVALGIVWDAVAGAFFHDVSTPGILAIYAALFSILANEGLYWYTIIVSRRINSEMLRANAWHHRTDAISSVVVLIGVVGAMLGWPYLDSLAAVIVGVMVAKIGWDLGWSAMQELVDSALDEETVGEATRLIQAIDGVRSIHMFRTRRHGHQAAADVHVQVSPYLSVSEGHMISQMVEDKLKDSFEAITDVTVHIDPEDDEVGPRCRGLPLREDALQRLRACFPELSEDTDIRLHYLAGKIDLELVLPLAEYESERATRALRTSILETLADEQWAGQVSILYR